jgi:MSHA biogenesis protein MshL
MMIYKSIITTGLIMSLSACQSLPKTHSDPTDIKTAVKQSVQDATKAAEPPKLALTGDIESAMMLEFGDEAGVTLSQPQERRFDINARNVAASTFFTSLVQGSPLSVAIHSGVTGTISMKLNQVTLSETMDQVSEMYGYDIRRKGRVLHIYPAGMRVEVIPVNYLYIARSGSSSISVSSGGVSESSSSSSSDSSSSDSSSSSSSSSSSNGTEISTSSTTDFWTELEKNLTTLLNSSGSDGRSLVVSPQSSLVTVRAYPDEIRTIKDYLAQAETQLQRQVILEAKIIEVELSEAYQQGIDWSTSNFTSSAASLTNDIVSNIGGTGTLTLGGGSFELAISLLSTQGKVNVLSSPRVTASNNQKAVIKVGTDEYFVTDFSTDTDDDDNTTVDVDLTAFFSGIALDVTPQINANNDVLLHVHPSVIDVDEQDKTITYTSDGDESTISLPLAYSDTREADTVIKARSGEVVVIGGLMSSSNEEYVSKIPFIGDIPWIGELFTDRSTASTKTELIILIKPTVVERNTWRRQIEASQTLLEEWYPEGL